MKYMLRSLSSHLRLEAEYVERERERERGGREGGRDIEMEKYMG
jgi:hypothetical protein